MTDNISTKWTYAYQALKSIREKGHYKEIHDKMVKDGWHKDQTPQSTYTFLKRRASHETDILFLGYGVFALPMNKLTNNMDIFDILSERAKIMKAEHVMDSTPIHPRHTYILFALVEVVEDLISEINDLKNNNNEQ